MSICLDTRAMVLFRRHKTAIAPWHPSTALVTDGPYRRTRNPMYLGMASLFLGLTLSVGLLWGLAVLPLVMGVIDIWVVRPEEKHLEQVHGDAYRSYRSEVPRWL